MATIPLTGPDMSLGGRLAQPGANFPIPQPYNAGQSLVNAGAALDDVAREVQQRREKQDALKASLALATATNQAAAASDDINRKVLAGNLSPDDARAELRRQLNSIQSDQTRDLPREHAATIGVQLTSMGGQLSRQLEGSIYKAGESANLANLDDTAAQLRQQVQRRGPANVSDSYDAILDFTGSAAGLTPEQIAARKRSFRQGSTAVYYELQGTTQHAAQDLPGVTATLNTVLGPAGEEMTPEQRDHVITHLVGLQSNLKSMDDRARRQLELDAQAREHDAVDAYNAARTVVFNGQYLSTDAIANLNDHTSDTKMAQAALELLAVQDHAVNFASAPASARATMLERYRAEAANPALGTSPEGAKQLTLMEQLDGRIKQAQQDNPWKAAQTYGVITNAPLLDVTDPGSIGPTLDVRMQKIGKVEAWVGQKVSPLQPEEAQQLAKDLKSLPVDQAAGALSMMGLTVRDPERIAALTRQIDDKDGALGLAMSYAGDVTESGKLTAEYILRGAQAIKDKTADIAGGSVVLKGWKEEIATQIRGAFSDRQVEDRAIDAAFLIAAGRSVMGKSDDIGAAVTMATGGITTHGAAEGKIPLPMGLDAPTFEKRIAAITPAMLLPQATDGKVYAGGAPIALARFTAQLPGATLIHAGQGLYAVKAGSSFVTNAQGKRIILRITQ